MYLCFSQIPTRSKASEQGFCVETWARRAISCGTQVFAWVAPGLPVPGTLKFRSAALVKLLQRRVVEERFSTSPPDAMMIPILNRLPRVAPALRRRRERVRALRVPPLRGAAPRAGRRASRHRRRGWLDSSACRLLLLGARQGGWATPVADRAYLRGEVSGLHEQDKARSRSPHTTSRRCASPSSGHRCLPNPGPRTAARCATQPAPPAYLRSGR